jgi:hypothetical protein
VRIVTCVAVLALVAVLPAGAAAPTDLAASLGDGSIVFLSSSGERVGDLVGPGATALTPPAWSPDGRHVAFAREGIVVADLDGGLHRLTTAPSSGADAGPTWSPDGTQIAFRRYGGGTEDILAVRVVDGAVRRLTTDGAAKRNPQWQPGGSLVLFVQPGAPGGVYVVDAATGESRRVLPSGSEATWSPGGDMIAVTSGQGLEVVRPDGGGRRVLFASPYVSEPAWSPDGEHIAFTLATLFPQFSARGGVPAQHDVYVVDREGGGLARLTGFEGDTPFARPAAERAAWWPGGHRLFFQRGLDGNLQALWTMNSDGTCEQRFARSVAMWNAPVWSPRATPADAVECSSAQLRLQPGLTEVAARGDVPLELVVRNDGTQVLDSARVTLTASRGTLRIADGSTTCSTGTTSVCTVGSLARGAELRLVLVGSPRGTGNVTYGARISWQGAPDVDPAADETAAAATVAPCDVLGTWGSDRLAGTPRRDRICGRPGDDRIDGGAGNDFIDAGSGADTVIGGKGRDTIEGGGGGDVILVRDGERDVVDCGTEQDTVVADRLDVLRHCEHVTRASARHRAHTLLNG